MCSSSPHHLITARTPSPTTMSSQSLPPAYLLSHKESFKLRHFFFDSVTSASERQENCLVRDHLWLLVCTTMSLLSAIWFPKPLVSPAILCFYSCRQCFTCQPHPSPCGGTKRLHPHCLHSDPKETAQDPAPQAVIFHILLLFPAWIILPRCMHVMSYTPPHQ